MQTREPLVQSPNGAVELSNDEIARYSRHLIMPEVALDGQKKLKAAKVLTVGTGGPGGPLAPSPAAAGAGAARDGRRRPRPAEVLPVGTGGLGSPLALYLAAAGIGTIGIVDFDIVDESNLQRQIIHGTSDVGRPKVESARDKILDINPNVEVVVHEEALTSENALEIFADYDVIVDGTDNFPTRYLVNDACVLLGRGPRGAAPQRERARDLRRLRRDSGRHGQLPYPLPRQRRLRPPRQAERLRLHLPLRGTGERLLGRGRPLLPLPLPRAA